MKISDETFNNAGNYPSLTIGSKRDKKYLTRKSILESQCLLLAKNVQIKQKLKKTLFTARTL